MLRCFSRYTRQSKKGMIRGDRMTDLDRRVKKAIIRMADSMEDISQKLDYIIVKQTEDFFGRCG